jgi:hypothetical protein
MHHGWHEDSAREAYNEAIWSRYCRSCTNDYSSDPYTVPTTIGEELLTNLEQSAERLWLAAIQNLEQILPLSVIRTLVKNYCTTELGLTTEQLACMIRQLHPDWTDQQVADAVPCHRGSLNRFPRFKKLRGEIAAEGKSRRSRGSVDYREDARGRKESRVDGVVDDESLQRFIENGVREPFEGEED